MKPALFVPLIALFMTTAGAANWPAWRGPDADGTTREKNLPTEWSDSKNIRWKVPLTDAGNSTPIVWGDRIFLTQAVEVENRRTVICLDGATGKMLWQSGVSYREKDESHEANPHCSASPVTDGERVIAYFGSAGVCCYDLQGRELWHRDLGRQQHEWGYASSPVIHGDVCFVYHGPGPGAQLIGLNKKTGEIVWKFAEPPAKTAGRGDGFKGREPGYVGSWSTPLLVKAKGHDELVMSFPTLLAAFDPESGRQLWTCDGLNPLIYASPVYADGLVIAVGGFFGSAIAVRPGGNGDVTAAQRVWCEERAKKNRCGSGVVVDGRMFLVNMEGFAECIDLKTGRQLWEERMPRKGAKGDSWSSTLLAGDRIYAVNQSGDVIVLKAGPTFEVVAVNSIGDETTNASLVPCDGGLLLRTHKHLWCIGGDRKVASAR